MHSPSIRPTLRCATQHIEQNVDCDEEFQRTCRDSKKDEEEGKRHHGTNMSTYQVDTQFENYMARHAHTEMKTQDCQDNDKE